MEEYGFEIEVVELLDVVNHILPDEKQHWVSPTYLCRYKSGSPRIREPRKCIAIGWFRMDATVCTGSDDRIKEEPGESEKETPLPALPRYDGPMNLSLFPVNSVLLLGPTGVGKSPLGDVLARRGLFGLTCHHLDFGSELRRALSGGDASSHYTAPELAFIKGVLEQGLLLENEHFFSHRRSSTCSSPAPDFYQSDLLILNGIPRHDGQARDMEQIACVHALIVLDCSGEEILYRIRDNVGGDRAERSDDDVLLIEKKLQIFRERTAPLLRFYEQNGKKIYRLRVTATMSPAEAYRDVSALAAAHPPITLVTEPPQR